MSDTGINQVALDRFTSAHGGVGITLASFNVPWWAMLGITLGWELVENYLKDQKPHLFPYSSHDSAENSVADAAAVIVGFTVTRHLLRRGLTRAGDAALRSAVGATLGAFVGSGTFGLAARAVEGEPNDLESRGSSPMSTWGGNGYIAGCAAGAAVAGATIADQKYAEPAALGGGLGGAAFGPLGAAMGTYIAVGIAEDRT